MRQFWSHILSPVFDQDARNGVAWQSFKKHQAYIISTYFSRRIYILSAIRTSYGAPYLYQKRLWDGPVQEYVIFIIKLVKRIEFEVVEKTFKSSAWHESSKICRWDVYWVGICPPQSPPDFKTELCHYIHSLKTCQVLSWRCQLKLFDFLATVGKRQGSLLVLKRKYVTEYFIWV